MLYALVVVGLLIHAVMFGPQAAFVTEQFPGHVRYAGSSLAGVVGGGFVPLIIATLYSETGGTLRVSLYVVLALIVTLVAVGCARETAKKPLR